MKLNTKKIMLVGLAFLIICLFWQVYDNVIAKMLINTFGLNQMWSGFVMALDNILALVLLPVFGALSDKTKTKIGKRKPYIIVGVIISSILLVGVAIFDNAQRVKIEEQGLSNIETVNNTLIDDLDSQEQEVLRTHYGEYWFSYQYPQATIKQMFDLEKISADDIVKYFSLTDLELDSKEFLALCDKYLSEEEKNNFSAILSLTHEERTAMTFTEDSSFVDSILGKEANIVATRTYGEELESLAKILAEKISNDENKEEVLLQLGLKQFFTVKEYASQLRSKLAWMQTKNDAWYLVCFLLILLFVLVAMSIYRTPAVSLMPDVTPKPLRSKANAIINLMGAVGGVIALILMTFFSKDYSSYILLFTLISLIMIVLLIIFIATVNEPKLVEEMEEQSKEFGIEEKTEVSSQEEKMSKDVKKSFYLILASIIFWFMAYNAATTKFSVYAGNVLNMGYTIPLLIANVTAIISYIPIGIIASKFGRKTTVIAGVVILLVAFILGAVATENTSFLIYLTMGVAGIGWATINVNSYPMIVEMSKGSNIGKYTGYYYTASMFAQIITPIISGFVMDMFGTMKVLFPYSIVFCIFALCTMMFVKHGDSKPIPQSKLEAFDGD